jgi:hypothetical protein
MAVLIAVICYKRKSSVQTTHISTLSRVPYNPRLEVHQPYESPPTISRLDYPQTTTRDVSSYENFCIYMMI